MPSSSISSLRSCASLRCARATCSTTSSAEIVPPSPPPPPAAPLPPLPPAARDRSHPHTPLVYAGCCPPQRARRATHTTRWTAGARAEPIKKGLAFGLVAKAAQLGAEHGVHPWQRALERAEVARVARAAEVTQQRALHSVAPDQPAAHAALQRGDRVRLLGDLGHRLALALAPLPLVRVRLAADREAARHRLDAHDEPRDVAEPHLLDRLPVRARAQKDLGLADAPARDAERALARGRRDRAVEVRERPEQLVADVAQLGAALGPEVGERAAHEGVALEEELVRDTVRVARLPDADRVEEA